MDNRADEMYKMEHKARIDTMVSLAGKPLGMPNGLPDHAVNPTLADRVNQELLRGGDIREHMPIVKVQDHPGGLKRAYVIIPVDENLILSGKADGTDHDEAAFYAFAMALNSSYHGV